jgi:hypothetical protein
MIGFIRRSDLPVLIIGIVIAVPVNIASMFTLLRLFPRTPDYLAGLIAFCLLAVCYAVARYTWKWLEKRL